MTRPAPLPPPTILDLKTMGVPGAVISCTACGWMNVIAWDALKLDNTTPFPDIARFKRFACSCGSKAVNIMPDWAGYRPQGGGR